MQVALVQLALQGELHGRGLTGGGVHPCGSLLVVLLLLLPGMPSQDAGAVLAAGTGDWKLLLVSWCMACPMQHITEFSFKVGCPPR